MTSKTCELCGQDFNCGATSAEGCWCMKLPPLANLPASSDCLCPRCLSAAADAASSQPLKEGEDFYFNSEGLMVFTEAYHLKRGYCCKSGCKHCPY